MSHRPFEGSTVSARLQKYLKAAGINDGETPHSFRVGISYTLKGLGCTPEQIAQYVGWRSTEMALYYTRRSSASASLLLLELTGYTQPYFYGFSTRPATLRLREFAENFV